MVHRVTSRARLKGLSVHARACTHTHTRTRAHTHMHTHTHAHTRTHARTHTHACAHTRTHTHARTHTHTHTHTRIPMFTAAVFTIARIWRQLKCPAAEQWVQKMHIYVHNGILFSHEKE